MKTNTQLTQKAKEIKNSTQENDSIFITHYYYEIGFQFSGNLMKTKVYSKYGNKKGIQCKTYTKKNVFFINVYSPTICTTQNSNKIK